MSNSEVGLRTDTDHADLNAPSAEPAAAAAHTIEEDDEVAYDDEADEVEGEGHVLAEQETGQADSQVHEKVQCSPLWLACSQLAFCNGFALI